MCLLRMITFLQYAPLISDQLQSLIQLHIRMCGVERTNIISADAVAQNGNRVSAKIRNGGCLL